MAVTVSDQAQLRNYLPSVAAAVIALQEEVNVELAALGAAAGAADPKYSVKLATTGALAANTRVGNVLTANANGALGNIDGIATALNDRLLVKDEGTQANNGLYYVSALGSGGAPWSLTRTTDADESAEVTPNMLVMVEQGAVNQDKVFFLDVNGPVTLNTTALVFADFRGLAITAPADVDKSAAVVGTSLTVARADHKHDVSTAVVGGIAIGDVATEGTATSLARSDHVHSLAAPAAPADVTKAAAAVGVSTAPARADHKHDVSTAAPSSVGLANAEGVATSLARSDHVHNSGVQRGQVTLLAGVGTVNTGVTITANTRVIPILVTPGAGVSGTRYAVTGYVVGGPGVGAFTITAKDSAAGDNTVITDVSVFDWVAIEGTGV